MKEKEVPRVKDLGEGRSTFKDGEGALAGFLGCGGEAVVGWMGGQIPRAWGQAKLSSKHKTGASQRFQAGCRLESSL